MPDHMIAVLKEDGTWHAAYAQAPKLLSIYDDGVLTEMIIVLMDQSGNILADRSIKRGNYRGERPIPY